MSNDEINSGGILAPETELEYVCDPAADWRSWECVALEVMIPHETTIELILEVSPLTVGRPEYVERTIATIMVSGEGWKHIEVPLNQFDYDGASPAFWRFIKGITLRYRVLSGQVSQGIAIRELCLKHLGKIHLSSEVLSLAADAGESVTYRLRVANESDEHQAVLLSVQRTGWEVLRTEFSESQLILEPGASRECLVQVCMNNRVAPGGYETHTIQAVPNGDGNFREKIDFITVRKLPHPYLLHTEQGWEKVKRKVVEHAWAKQQAENYIQCAEQWIVPNVRGGEYAFELDTRFPFIATAIAWKLTGRKEFLDKCAMLIRRFVDPQNGYPSTRTSMFHSVNVDPELEQQLPKVQKVCSGTLIHEAEFMFDFTAAYDLLYDTEIWTERDRCLIRDSLLLFIQKADWAITDGDTNNIPAGAMAAALMCALVIQDMHWVMRFLYGHDGAVELLATGLMDDGWYFEGATNYVMLYAEIFLRLSQALVPWGINLHEQHIPPVYLENAMLAPWSKPREKPFLGMSFAKYGPVNKNYRCLHDLFDAILPYVDYRGILVAINDSTEIDARKVFEHAYFLYRDSTYAAVLHHSERIDLLYSVEELPELPTPYPCAKSAFSDNVGLCVLRSQTEGREHAEQIQVITKYGSHGGYHGHFDRISLGALSRHGRNVYSSEAAWYGYSSFLFKMWVQTSMAHNMVVVDQRMQEPTPSRRLLFHTGPMFQACAVETIARWSDPPYGGQSPYPERFPEDRIQMESRWLPVPQPHREKGDIGAYSEPILQRRLTLVTDDYVVIADYVKGHEIHEYDCLYHLQGFEGIDAPKLEVHGHTSQMNQDPYGAGQFVTDCNWYTCDAPASMHFMHEYQADKDNRDGKHSRFNDDGPLNVDLYTLWPPQQRIMVGAFPEAYDVNKKILYEIFGDDQLLVTGRVEVWVLGRAEIDVSVAGMKELTVKVNVSRQRNRTVFLGDPHIVTADGNCLYLSELGSRVSQENSHACEPSKDYYGGEVTIFGLHYSKAIPMEPVEIQKPATLRIQLEGLNASKFVGVLGGDFPIGDEREQRKTVSIRESGKDAKFVTLLEPYSENRVVRSATAVDPTRVRVELCDGRTQLINIKGMTDDGTLVQADIIEYHSGELTREEHTKCTRP